MLVTVLSNRIKGNKEDCDLLAETRQQVIPSQGDHKLWHSQAQGYGSPDRSVTNSGWKNWKDGVTQRLTLRLGVAQ